MVSPAQDNLTGVSYSAAFRWVLSALGSCPQIHPKQLTLPPLPVQVQNHFCVQVPLVTQTNFTPCEVHTMSFLPHTWGERTSVDLGRCRGRGSSDSPVEPEPELMNQTWFSHPVCKVEQSWCLGSS